LVNGRAQWTYFRPKTAPTEPNHAIFGIKTGRFRAKRDAQKSVNYVLAAGINHVRPFAGRSEKNYSYNYLWRFYKTNPIFTGY
jgi:hypothetical protein